MNSHLPMTASRKTYFGLRLAISLVLISALVVMIDMKVLIGLLASARWSFFFLALALVTLERFLLAYKWNLLLGTKKMSLPFGRIVRIYYLSSFIGTFLPSTVVADIFRGYSLYKYSGDGSVSMSSVFVEKIIALLSSVIVALAGLLVVGGSMGNARVLASVWLIGILFAGFLIVMFNRSIWEVIVGKVEFLSADVRNKIEKLSRSCFEYRAHKRVLFYVLALSFLFQVLRVFTTYALSLSLSQNVGIIYFFIFVPIIIVLCMLPVSVGGLGIREGAFVYFFTGAGMSASEAFALSVLAYVLVVLSSVPGGIIYLLEGLFVRGGGREGEGVKVGEAGRGSCDV